MPTLLLRPALLLPLLLLLLFPTATSAQEADASEDIPLPEHPRPDYERAAWLNLNGTWDFRFDSTDAGTSEAWQDGETDFPREITVPFPWGSALSGVEDEAEMGWYAREITVPSDWNGQRVFLVVGAADWETTAWLDGQELGTHQGGYTPFAFELTEHVTPGAAQRLVFRVDDRERAFKLEGKQGYGNARGIWQTVYLEARGAAPLASLHFTPDLADSSVLVEAALLEPAPADLTLDLSFQTGDVPDVSQDVPQGTDTLSFSVPIPDVRLWSLDDPFLYEVEATLGGDTLQADVVQTYFGMRDVGVVDLPGTDIPYIALNGEPVYVELALDQAYHPDGFYTFPSDDFIRDEVLMARQIGLNGLRVHVKIAHPRKLYWADRLGMLIMADVPNSWGEPTDSMHQEVEFALREMVRRDYNHPSIFAWVPFNETWGLKS
ncbi:MAG: glycoside hydrolase family 2 protein, partial [Rhodothermales bacterium]